MRKPQDRLVYRYGAGWANILIGAERAERIYPTQDEATRAARENLKNAGGGELTIQGHNGRFRDKNTVAPGNGRFPPRDKQ